MLFEPPPVALPPVAPLRGRRVVASSYRSMRVGMHDGGGALCRLSHEAYGCPASAAASWETRSTAARAAHAAHGRVLVHAVQRLGDGTTLAWRCARSAGIVRYEYVVGGGAIMCDAGGARFYVRKHSVNGAAACCACWALLSRSKCGGRRVPPWYRGGP